MAGWHEASSPSQGVAPNASDSPNEVWAAHLSWLFWVGLLRALGRGLQHDSGGVAHTVTATVAGIRASLVQVLAAVRDSPVPRALRSIGASSRQRVHDWS